MLRSNSLLKHVIDGKIEEKTYLEQEGEEEVRSYWTTFKKRDDNGFLNRKYLIDLVGRGCRLIAR